MNLLTESKHSTLKVSARSLFPYIAHPDIAYDKWVESLSWRHPYGRIDLLEHLTSRHGGEVALSMEYADFCLHQNVPDIITAIGALLIHEALEGKYGESPDCVNFALDGHHCIARNYGLIGATQLQRFLGIDMDHDLWIAGLKKKHKIRFKQDYFWYVPKQGPRIMVFHPIYAMQVACEAQTPRGRFIQEFHKTACDMRRGWSWR